MGKRLVSVQDMGLTRLQVACESSCGHLLMGSQEDETARQMAWLGQGSDGGCFCTPAARGFFPPSHPAVFPAVNWCRGLGAGPC